MNTVKMLDCTLRDGGYCNDWQFGRRTIQKIISGLEEAKIDYIECGFLTDKTIHTPDISKFNFINELDEYLTNENVADNLVFMLNYGEFNVENLPQYAKNCKIFGLRLAFHKKDCEMALRVARIIQEKGYKVFLQPMVVMSYTDAEFLELIKEANEIKPYAFYLVDSLGTLYKNNLLHLFYLIDNNLNKEIKIGFHSHNNLQLSFSNAQELLLMNSKRDIIIDSSVFGMGRGAGNLCTELLAQYINKNIDDKYNIIPILEIMDEYIMPIFANKPWGYSAPYYIAAVNECHPNYATYLMGKQTLCIRDIHAIIKHIPINKRQLYDKDLIAEAYREYQAHNIDDGEILKKLSDLCSGKTILILAPGKSLLTYEKRIKEFIKKYNPFIIAVNHVPEIYSFDLVFVSNLKRFKGLNEAYEKLGAKLLCTSNISDGRKIATINYSSYLNEEDAILDNAGTMIINVMRKIGITKISLAGYDGFETTEADNYFNNQLNLNIERKNRENINAAMKTYFGKLLSTMDINFITPSVYKEK